jgi:hypothetical protein
VPVCLSNLDETQDVRGQKRVIMDTAGNFFVGKLPSFRLPFRPDSNKHFIGGADTSVSSICTFILQMILNPDIQAKAQAELDRVVGKYILPTFADELSLPYIGATVKEILRCGLPPHSMTRSETDMLYLSSSAYLLSSPRWLLAGTCHCHWILAFPQVAHHNSPWYLSPYFYHGSIAQ